MLIYLGAIIFCITAFLSGAYSRLNYKEWEAGQTKAYHSAVRFSIGIISIYFGSLFVLLSFGHWDEEYKIMTIESELFVLSVLPGILGYWLSSVLEKYVLNQEKKQQNNPNKSL